MVWLSAGGVSLIYPMCNLDWFSNIGSQLLNASIDTYPTYVQELARTYMAYAFVVIAISYTLSMQNLDFQH